MKKLLKKMVLGISLTVSSMFGSSQPFVGEITMFAGTFAPNGWALCDGQLISISTNPALFSLLGTTYGGDGTTTFALPDLRGRAPIHVGTGPGLPSYALGATGGYTNSSAVNSVLNSAEIKSGRDVIGTIDTSLQNTVTGTNGRSPYVGINYIIALTGIFPPRN